VTAALAPTPAEVLADLIVEGIRRRHGAVGVLVRDVPAPEPNRLMRALAALRDDGTDLRIAYLREGGQAAAKAAGFVADCFSTEVEQAERWRNERDLKALIVVVAHGDEAKLSSLADFSAITSRDLKDILVSRALGEEASQNEVQARWWNLLADDDGIGLAPLIDYYTALSGKTDQAFLDASSREIDRLGLLPDPEFFNDPREAAVSRRLERNRELASRLQVLNAQDRRRITDVLQAEKDPAARKSLQEALSQLDRTRIEGTGGKTISFQAADQLVRARVKKPKNTESKRPATQKVVTVAAEALTDNDRHEDVATIVGELQKQLNNLDEGKLRPETIRIKLPDGATEAVTTARLDLLNLLGKMLGPDTYGGLIEVDAPDLENALRRFDIEQHLLARWQGERIGEFLDHLSDHEAGAALRECFRTYVDARAKVLPLMRILAVEPLAVAAHPPTRQILLTFIAAYESLNATLREKFEPLYQRFGQDANEVLGHLLLLETIALRVGGRTYAILAPTHPLFLWHYARYAEIVDAQRLRLDERDCDLIRRAAERLPFFMTSIFMPSAALSTQALLMYLGRLGPLPYFGEKSEGGASDDGLSSVRSLVEAQLALEPHSQRGYRLGLVDPPDAGVYLSMLADLADEGKLSGAHLTVYRHPQAKIGVELRLDDAEEDRIARVFQAITTHRLFTFEVRQLPRQEFGPGENDLHHLVVVFDRSDSQVNPARAALHPIQPLASPRRIAYRELHKTVELEPASGGPFEDYDNLVRRLAATGNSYLAVHQQKKLREALQAISVNVPWTAIADRQVDRDLRIGQLRTMTARDGERDVVGFARSTIPFRRPLRDVVREYNAYISPSEIDDLLEQLSDLLDAGILNLRPDASGKTNFNRIKGLLGTLIAARWFRKSGDDGTRLLISLDSAEARRWLHLSDDPLRADLVGFTWTNDHCTVSVIEVKAVQAKSVEYNVENGVVTGPAIDQMLSTRRLLEQVISTQRNDELITTPARREILREHLYRELTKGAYTADERKLWADALQRLLDGSVETDVRCHLIDVRLGVDSSSLKAMQVIAHEGTSAIPVEITELNERQIEVLIPSKAFEPEPEGDDGSAAPQPTEPDVPEPVAPEPETARPEAETSAASLRPEPPAESPTTPVIRPRAKFGMAPGEYGRPREIWFDPEAPDDRLPNPHLMITGETGSGKTQATKAILADLRALDVPALILDFKDDYSDPIYADAEGLSVYDPSGQTLPFNPLAPAVDPRSGRVNPTHHVHQLTDIVKRIYHLGDQQAYRLREAMKAVYESAGVPMRAFVPNPNQTYPGFEAIQEELREDKDNQALLGRMSPIFDLDLFSSGAQVAQFAEVVERSTVIRLGQLPGDEVKNSVAEFFLMALYNYLIRQPQSHRLARLAVLDEAWRLVESPFLEPLMREGRAFGLGVVIASQFPTDLPIAVAGSTATKLYFSQTNVEQIREIQRTILGKTSGSDADHLASIMRGLPPLTGILYSKQFPRFVRVTINPYFERHPSR
jgi:Helicase HerA, central domain